MGILSSPPPLVDIQKKLSTLRVTHANLSSLPDTYFSGCDKLRSVVLSYNHLTTLPDLSAISDTLHIIQLAHNDLIDVSSLQNLVFPILQYVILHHNEIDQLDIRRFILPWLHEMDVSYNLLEKMSHPGLLAAISPRKNGLILSLIGNPWYCDGNLSWIASASQKVHQYTDTVDLYWNTIPVHVINAQDMICYMPPSMRGKQAIRVGRYQPFSY